MGDRTRAEGALLGMLAWVLLRRVLATSDGSFSDPHQPRLTPDSGCRGGELRALGRAQLGKRLACPARATSRASTRRWGTCCSRPCAPAAPGCPSPAPRSRLAFRGSLPTGPRLGRRTRAVGRASVWRGKLGLPLSPPLQRRRSVLWVECVRRSSDSGHSTGGTRAIHPAAGEERMVEVGETRVNQQEEVLGPRSYDGGPSWKSLLLHPGHFKRRWRQTAGGCRPDSEPPSFQSCSALRR
ncbi:uncharacterized protein LOC119468428 [Cebus imitator]|uniref:uncharacterized protein LOC119468428 n=1 Tax=Cebus imitator TaxID=2715852 RepID=UPI001898A82A|nr:uncharacterized protein LOC119468428 [Cebus imitator]